MQRAPARSCQQLIRTSDNHETAAKVCGPSARAHEQLPPSKETITSTFAAARPRKYYPKHPSPVSRSQHDPTMKILSLATAVSSALVATTASAEMCTVPQLTAIMSTQHTMPCMTESGLDFTKLSGTPSQALMTKFCKSSSCLSLLKAVLAQNPPDCTVPMSNVLFRSQLFNPIMAYCDASSASGTVNAGDAGATPNAATHSGSSSSSNGTHTGKGNGNGNGNGNATAHSNSSSSSSSNTAIEGQTTGDPLLNTNSSSSLSDADSSTPVASTKSPTPTPKSGATSLAVSACAGVLGAAALVWVM